MSLRRRRRILVDARTPVHYAMFAPVHRAMEDDDRVRFSFIASDEPAQAASIFRDAGADAAVIGPMAAALMKFDAYLTSDFTWTRLLHETCRIQMFHGVGGKYGFDAPTEPLDAWHRLFFVNRRRLNNCVASGALDADSPAIRMIGMPKVDCLVDGSLSRDAVLSVLGLSARSADRPLRANLVAGVVAEPARRRAAEAPAPAAGERHRQAARSIVRSAAAVLRRHRLAGDARARTSPPERRCWRQRPTSAPIWRPPTSWSPITARPASSTCCSIDRSSGSTCRR